MRVCVFQWATRISCSFIAVSDVLAHATKVLRESIGKPAGIATGQQLPAQSMECFGPNSLFGVVLRPLGAALHLDADTLRDVYYQALLAGHQTATLIPRRWPRRSATTWRSVRTSPPSVQVGRHSAERSHVLTAAGGCERTILSHQFTPNSPPCFFWVSSVARLLPTLVPGNCS
jgi:hypothetical protein